MIVSRKWLQNYFDTALPGAEAIDDALTFHAFEIDGVEKKGDDDIIDVKVLPNRAADCFSHRGIARELGAILQLPMKPDSLRAAPAVFPSTDELVLTVDDARACRRHMGALVRGVKVGPSPDWLREALESVGQRSINNVVDATNYVMFDLGQPLHAFDAGKLEQKEGKYHIRVRGAGDGEKLMLLSGESYDIPKGVLVISNDATGEALDIAGVKGGAATAITPETTDLFVSVANFDGVMIRRAAQLLKLWTDAGKRFQNNLSPELPAYGMRAVLELIKQAAGGELVGVADFYPAPVESVQVPTSVTKVNAVLGSSYQGGDLAQVFDRLGLAHKRAGDDFTVESPFERRDLKVSEDLAEEVGRILGYDGLPSSILPPLSEAPDQLRLAGIERVKDFLAARGFTEVSTQSFATEGARILANPLQNDHPALRDSLAANMQEALARAVYSAPRSIGPVDAVRLFEIGMVFQHASEHLSLALGAKAMGKQQGDLLADTIVVLSSELGIMEPILTDGIAEFDLSTIEFEKLGVGYAFAVPALGAFKTYSAYPFILRDIALWTPVGTRGEDVEVVIRAEAGPLLARIDQFDSFEKDGRISYAFRLVFESFDRTLSDVEVNPIIEKVSAALAAKGYEVR